MSTQLEKISSTQDNVLASASVSFESDEKLIEWMEAQANEHQLSYLLAHAVDGVIWGRFDEGKLITADKVDFSGVELPALRLKTLQQCWIFGQAGEIFLWTYGGKWRSRHLSAKWEEPYLQAHDYIEEAQLLWGTHAKQETGFSLLRDGSQGLKHAIPTTAGITFDLKENDKLATPARLTVRHYIEYNPDDGLARVFLSRLVSLNA